MKNHEYLHLVTILIFSLPTSSEDLYYVKQAVDDSPNNVTCPSQLCLTANQIGEYATSNSTFIFSDGNYTLERPVVLIGVSDVTLKGEGRASSILWSGRAAIQGKKLTNLKVEHLSFKFSGPGNYQGAALEIYHSSSGICILNSTFRGSGSLNRRLQKQAIYILGSNMSITSCFFARNSGEFGGALDMSDGSIVSLIDSVFTDNQALNFGGAVSARNHSVLNVQGTVFQHNFGRASAGAIYCRHCVLSITGVNTFENNYSEVSDVTSSGGAISIDSSKLAISGRALFLNNTAVQGGAIGMVASLAEIIGDEIVFENNLAYFYYGGAFDIKTSSVNLSANFTHNVARTSGGAVYVDSSPNSNVTIGGYFVANDAITLCGGAVYVENANTVTFKGATMKRNSNSAICSHRSNLILTGSVLLSNNSGRFGGAFHLSYTTISFRGNITSGNNTADKGGGAVYAISTNITFRESVTFYGNTAQDGGGLYFKTFSSMTLEPCVNVTMSHNQALRFGGGIFYEDVILPSQCRYSNTSDYLQLPRCFIQLDIPLQIARRPIEDIRLISRDDTAKQEGNFIYGGLLDRCRLYEASNRINTYQDFGKIVPLQIFQKRGVIHATSDRNNDSEAISSEPYELCFCDGSGDLDCQGVLSKEVYRGERFAVSVIAITQDGSATTSITTVTSPTSSLKLDQSSQLVFGSCYNLTYNVYSIMDYEELTLYPNGPCRDTGYATAVVSVKLLPCPDGFTQFGELCLCEERLQAYDAQCSIDEDVHITVKADSKFWMGVVYDQNASYQGLILYENCPPEYCETNTINITLQTLNLQCNFNRRGVLCGACQVNFSQMFGSSRCAECPNTYLTLLLPFAAAGIALVVFLSVLRLTVASGMINGVILFANIVQANKILFFSNNSVTVLSVFIAWLNLDIGIEMCFFYNMTAYTQTWLQYAFPLYVWMLISIIIIASRYSVFLSKLIGHNPVSVLATLFLMSYAKVLKVIIDVYSSARLDYPQNKIVTVWLKDGNVPYLESWHLLLTVVTSLVLVFFFLPYTLLLLIGHKLYRFSGKKYFCWFNRLKPLLDAYYAPYKLHTRYWTGLLLLVRCVLYVVFSYNSLRSADKTYLAIVITFTGIIVLAWLSVKIYRHFYNNVLEAMIYINLIVLSATALAGVNVANYLVGIVLAMMLSIILYHFFLVFIAKSKLWKILSEMYRELVQKIFKKPSVEINSPPAETSSRDPHQIVTKTVVELREPLLEDRLKE